MNLSFQATKYSPRHLAETVATPYGALSFTVLARHGDLPMTRDSHSRAVLRAADGRKIQASLWLRKPVSR